MRKDDHPVTCRMIVLLMYLFKTQCTKTVRIIAPS